MLNIMYKALGLFFIVFGAFNLYSGIWGSMWHDPDYAPYLGYLQWYVLRPCLLVTGVAGLFLLGPWLLIPDRWRQIVFVNWDWVMEDREMDLQYPDVWTDYGLRVPRYPWYLWEFIKSLWIARTCFIGRHPQWALTYCRGGEDGPRGTTCICCDERISIDNVTPRRTLRGEGINFVSVDEPDQVQFTEVRPDSFRIWPPCDKES